MYRELLKEKVESKDSAHYRYLGENLFSTNPACKSLSPKSLLLRVPTLSLAVARGEFKTPLRLRHGTKSTNCGCPPPRILGDWGFMLCFLSAKMPWTVAPALSTLGPPWQLHF